MEILLITYLGSVAVSAFASLTNVKKIDRIMRKEGLILKLREDLLQKFEKDKPITRNLVAYGTFFIPIANIIFATTAILIASSNKIEDTIINDKCVKVKDINTKHLDNSPYTNKQELEKKILEISKEGIPSKEKQEKMKNFRLNGKLPLQAYRLVKSIKKANDEIEEQSFKSEFEREKINNKLVTKYIKEMKQEHKNLENYGKKLEKTIFKTRA